MEPQSSDIHVNDKATFTMSPAKTSTKIKGFERKGEAWCVATQLQSDLVVEVGDLNFHLHKFPLLSRSGRINRLVFESRDVEKTHIVLAHMPGGTEAFELAARFCYGMPVDLSTSNIAAVRCMADYLEMSDDLEEGNLTSKAETFLKKIVLPSWKNSIAVLKSCERLSPWAEDAKIVQRCCESIAWKACTDPRGVRSPHALTSEETNNPPSSFPSNKLGSHITKHISQDWWFDEVASLTIGHFTKTIAAMSAKGMRPDLIGLSIVHYSWKWLPHAGRLEHETVIHYPEEDEERSEAGSGISDTSIKDNLTLQRQDLGMLEHIVRILPRDEDAIPSKFLVHLIRIANMLDAGADCKADLEKRVGSQLDQATLNDLLIPAFCSEHETTFDVELVQRLVEYFLLKEQNNDSISSPLVLSEEPGLKDSLTVFKARQAAKVKVAKLLDSYLSEIARDRNLSLSKFQRFAEIIPESGRLSHDGLYRAIDIFLKTHPSLTEHERKKLCKIMDCHKLSLQACLHAAQNERLPLRTAVQVLFCDHMKVRSALTGKETEEFHKSDGRSKAISILEIPTYANPQLEGMAEVNEEMRSMRLEMQKMKEEISKFRSEYSQFHQEIHHFAKHKILSTLVAGLRKLGKVTYLHSHHKPEDRAGNIPSPNHAEHRKHQRNWRHSVS